MTTLFNRPRSGVRELRRLALPGVLLALALALATIPAAAEGTIDINTATAEEFAAAMAGVGLKKARAIVAYRDENGPFASIEDLVKVSGIGPATLDSNRDRLSITEPEADPPAPNSG